MERFLPGLRPTAVAVFLLSSCVGSGSPDRLVVSKFAFDYAEKSNRDIMDSLPASQAYQVLAELGRIRPRGQLSLEPGKTLRSKPSTVPAGTAADGAMEVARTTKSMTELQKGMVEANGTVSEWEDLRTYHQLEVLKSGFYFSTVTAVAIEDRLRPTAIPALVLGFRPSWDERPNWRNTLLRKLEGWGVGYDLMVGGALNGVAGGTEGDGDIALAVGAGITIPWSDAGALSLGVTNWRTESTDSLGNLNEDDDWAIYVGISLGGFNVSGSGD